MKTRGFPTKCKCTYLPYIIPYLHKNVQLENVLDRQKEKERKIEKNKVKTKKGKKTYGN